MCKGNSQIISVHAVAILRHAVLKPASAQYHSLSASRVVERHRVAGARCCNGRTIARSRRNGSSQLHIGCTQTDINRHIHACRAKESRQTHTEG